MCTGLYIYSVHITVTTKNLVSIHLHTVDLSPHFTLFSPSPLCHVYFCLVCSLIVVFISLFFILHK